MTAQLEVTMEEDIKKYLHWLNSEKYIKKPKEAAILIQKICHCFKQEQSQFSVGLLIGLVLDDNEGIFSFIWKTCNDLETVSSSVAALKLLESLITEYQKCTEPYFRIIYEKCLNLVSTNFAKVKELSLKLIKNLITLETTVTFDLAALSETLNQYLCKNFKTSSLFFKQMQCILGYLFQKYPEVVKNYEKTFFSNVCLTLDQEMTKQNESTSKIEGALEGMNGYFVNFSPPDNESIVKIYIHLKKLSEFQKERRPAGRAALKLVQTHWTLFSDLIFYDRDIWKNNLTEWLKQSPDDRQSSFCAFNGFYSIIALNMKKDLSSFHNIKSFIKDFRETLESSDSNFYQKKTALIGIKLFVLTKCLEGDDFDEMHQIFMKFVKNQESLGHLTYFPLCIECLSAFVLNLNSSDMFSTKQMVCLQRLSVTLIDNFPKIESTFQTAALTALEKSFYMLALCDLRVLENHLSKVLYQGLLRTCSYTTLTDLELLREEETLKSDLVSYKSYLSLWNYLLSLADTSNLPVGGSFDIKKGVTAKVFDAFFNSFVKIISKLNLKAKMKKVRADVDVELENPSDIQIFVNCVDLYGDLIPPMTSLHLPKWIARMFHLFMNLSYENPQVAGFYKLISSTLKVADSIQFFEEPSKNLKCCELLTKFLENLTIKVNQYKGDLQVVCLQTLLSAPVTLIESFIENLVPALEVVVRLGQNDFPLLKEVVETLERWNLRLSNETTSVVMKKLLPHFDVFFQSQYFKGNNLVNSSIEGKKLKKKLKFSDSEFLDLQKRFLIFLGSLDSNVATNLIELSGAVKEERNISDKELFYYLPFGSGRTEINLENVLTRVIELSLSCSDRKTRITACELFYSCVMIILNNINQLNGGYTCLFRKIIKTCLVLGSDSDNVVYQIFEPLMFQITHYFSGKKAMHFLETQDLVDILIDHVTVPYDPTLRDFSALLIAEFTDWSIKQLTPEELRITPDSINKILNSIYSLALHPCHYKRVGAAVVFNRVYTVLREEEHILDAYWFQLYYCFMESLRMCHRPEDVSEIIEAIQHVKRPLVERHEDFNEVSQYRITPDEFEGGVLYDLVLWTTQHCQDERPFLRRTAMTLVKDFAPVVRNCNSVRDLVRKRSADQLFLEKEASFDASNSNEDEFVHWLNCKSAIFEYYTWLLNENVLSSDEVSLTGFSRTSQMFISNAFSKIKNSHAVEVSKRESVLNFLNLLLALKKKAYYFPTEVWDLVKILIFKPSEFGFDLNQASASKNLFLTLTPLLKYFLKNLTQYNWDYFYENLEHVVVVPVISHITRNQTVSLTGLEFVFSIRVLLESGVWDDLVKRMCFLVDGGLLIEIVFRSLFTNQGKKKVALSLEPSCKTFLEELMLLACKIGVSPDRLFDFIENSEEVTEEDTRKVITKGDYFMLQFNNIVLSILENQSDLLLKKIFQKKDELGIRLLVQILENSGFPHEQSKLPREILSRWEEFEQLEISNTTPKRRKEMLLHLGLSAANAVGMPGCLKESTFAEWIFSFLENQKVEANNISEVERIFNSLLFLSKIEEKLDDNPRLLSGLTKFLAEQKTMKDFVNQGSFKRTTLDFLICGLLRNLKVTGSLVVLYFAATVADWLESFCKKEEMEMIFGIFGTLSADHSLSALNVLYDQAFKAKESSFFVSHVYGWLLLPLMRSVPNFVLREFVVTNLENLCDLIRRNWNEIEGCAGVVRSELLKKRYAAGIIETFVTKLTKEELDEVSSEKKLVIEKILKSFGLLMGRSLSPSLKERHRMFMCAMFNMVAAVLSSRCTEKKVFKLLLFDERGSYLYLAVDHNHKYNLHMDFDEVPKRKKYQTSLRKLESDVNLNKTLNSVKYIQTNTLISSTFREDVTAFDFFRSPIRPMNSLEDYNSSKSVLMEIELEADDFNNHECMATVVGVIMKMVQDKITPLPADEESITLPCWLSFFFQALKDPKASENFKLFALKVLYNVQNYVKPYAKIIFSHFVEFISVFFQDYPINYFLVDLIEMMTEWRPVPEDAVSRRQLTNLVKMVIKKSDSFRRDILKRNLELVQKMIEIWKEALLLSNFSEFVFNRFLESASNTDFPAVAYTNVKVAGILLSNKIIPWKEGSEKSFFEFILQHFTDQNKDKQIFAEVCGLALSHLQETSSVNFEECKKLVSDKISSENVSWIPLLYGVHKHYSKICGEFVFKIFSSAYESSDSLKADRLEMLLAYVSSGEPSEDDTFDRCAHSFLIEMLNSSDARVQEISLQIAEKLLMKLKEDKLKGILKEVVHLQKSSYPGVRKWVYKIAQKCYLQQPQDGEMKKPLKIILLKGLNDDLKELQESCVEFWREYLNLSPSFSSVIKLIQEMYMPETEDIFLSNTVKILLDYAASSDQSCKPIFPHPITHQSVFQKRTLNLSKSRNTFLPSFMSSRISTNQSLECIATLKNHNLPFKRPTVSTLKFEPTVDANLMETSSTVVETSEETQVLKLPSTVRFHKSLEKKNSSYVRWLTWKKKKELEKEEEKLRKESQVEIYGEYSWGDYPNIQISQSQILKPLGVLAKRDPQIGREFLVSFFLGLIEPVSSEERETFFLETNKCLDKILTTSTSFDPGVFGFVLQFLLKHCKNLKIDCEKISNAAVSSNWLSLGTLIVESIIEKNECSDLRESKNAKRRRGSTNFQDKIWLELAKLYRGLEEFDVVSGIFLDKLKVQDDERKAILCEALMNWPSACENYKSVLQVDAESHQSEFYKESYFLCLARLSDWSSLNHCVRGSICENFDELWTNYNLLSWFLKSEMMLSLGLDRTDYRSILEDFNKNKAKMNVLSTNFGEEMAVFDWLSGKLQKANYRIDRLCLDFLAGWSHLNCWSYNLRAGKLTSLQTISELSLAIKTLSEEGFVQRERNLKLCSRLWEKNLPSSRDDLFFWDVKLRYRKELLKQLKEPEMNSSLINSNLAIAKAALSQENLSLAKEYLSGIKDKVDAVDVSLKAEYNYCMNLGKMVVAKLKMSNESEGLRMYLDIWRKISREIPPVAEPEFSVTRTHLLRCNFILGLLVSEILDSVTKLKVSPEVITSISSWLETANNGPSVVQSLKSRGLGYFIAAKEISETLDEHSSAKSDTYLELVKFLIKFSDLGSFTDFETLGTYLLKAMSLGNPEARQLFGCLLNMSRLVSSGSSLEGLVKESSSVSSWMFLLWINQILANLNSALFPFLKVIVLRIAEEYPNAIRYPFRVSKKRFESGGANLQTFSKKLSLLLSDHLQENFLTAMNYLGFPDVILRHHLENALKEIEIENSDCSQIQSTLSDLHRLMFSSDNDKFRGLVFTYWKNFKSSIEECLLAGKNMSFLRKKIKTLFNSIETTKISSKKSSALLESYSPWLRDFHHLKGSGSLELPGQYDGSHKPIKKYLVTISSFKRDVVAFNSKCRPMRITILGNDAGEHKFLVKSGEDLRQDQRIQQVFAHFNQRLKEHKQSKRFSVDTFKVIPLTFILGMIEWIDNTVSFHDMMVNALEKDENLIAEAQVEHLKCLCQNPSVLENEMGHVAAHLDAYETVKRATAVYNFNLRVQSFPSDLLKKSFWTLSSSPEHFVYLRRNFATSHAVMCITHWLLGIGDRHLQNTLVSTRTGRVLGIDFGYAFGFATQFLTPPELIPFRLTPQILNLMYPLNESGWIKQTMVHCLRVFRKEEFKLLSFLEVFTLEPLIDWLEQARKDHRCRTKKSFDQYPKQKVERVLQKLRGVNPVLAFKADLLSGHSESKYLKNYLEVVKGENQHNVRSRYKNEGLTEEEQVECLIDLATDPHVLAKTYVGWNAWL